MKFTNKINQLALVAMLFSSTSLSQTVESPTTGPPASSFAAASTMPAEALRAAAARASKVPKLAQYPVAVDPSSKKSTIHSDWASFNQGAALSWIADMDVDCDGVNHECEGNPDGQSKTNWGALDAFQVPYIVIPDKFLSANPAMLTGNNIAAVICDGKILYGILGDTNGDTPQVTGEASWLMARTCFPNDGLNGIKGHNAADVTYILFTGPNSVLPHSAVDDKYITDFDMLRSMGDRLLNDLISNLDLSGEQGITSGAPRSTAMGAVHGI
ncbi:hypothetical protein FE257_002295 [Aspergillus nanangensis]|uniref:Endo-chitosanase n=1 Tax=Aspergillus nanangensis TaxID=2582783 RepID=A0AAD4CD73_ASPNN|nr:hypothetical protein FE257_002295 [Aspergillus nanangensis]